MIYKSRNVLNKGFLYIYIYTGDCWWTYKQFLMESPSFFPFGNPLFTLGLVSSGQDLVIIINKYITNNHITILNTWYKIILKWF